MKLKDILRRKGAEICTIAGDASLYEAAQELARRNIGVLLVVDAGEQPVGILSERDIVQRLAGEAGTAASATVADTMTRELIIGEASDTVEYAMQVMTQQRIRHLPVVEDGRLTGLVSIGDLVKAHINAAETEIRYLHSYIQGTRT